MNFRGNLTPLLIVRRPAMLTGRAASSVNRIQLFGSLDVGQGPAKAMRMS